VSAESSSPSWPDLLTALRGDAPAQVWRTAAGRLRDEPHIRGEFGRRRARLAILATHTTDFLTELLPVAALSCGIDLTVYQAPYGQMEAELLDNSRPIHANRPDYVLLSGTEEDLNLGRGPADDVVSAAMERWCGLWARVAGLGARVIQCAFASSADDAYGNRAAAVADSDTAIVWRVNAELLRRGADRVLFVDCDRLAAETGRRAWRDPRHMDMLHQPVSLAALPVLARSIAGVLGADLSLSRRCVVVDLDNTLWGGVLGEDGIRGVAAAGPEAAAFQRFQRYLISLRRRGMALAVASKNDADLAERALDEVPGMLLRRDDFALVVADWRPKSEQLREIAERLGLGLDSMAFVDDNPAERAEVASRLPEVDVIPLPAQPAGYVRALAWRPTLEPGTLTADDLARAQSYAALRGAEDLRMATDSLEEFLDGLSMSARVRVIGKDDIPRAVQLVQKTNQFNLTTRRHSRERIEALASDPSWRCFALSLSDRFADHGTVGLLLMRLDGETAEIDTLLLSCRVIGRTAERRLVAAAAAAARAAGCARLTGAYMPTSRNRLVADVYPELGFTTLESGACEGTGGRLFVYDLDGDGPEDTPHLKEESA
jgi:FkbH-like protein